MKKNYCVRLFVLISFVCVNVLGYGVISQAAANDDDLLNLYFRRVDGFYQSGKYNEARNELSKVYVIDPENDRAKEYEANIDMSEQEVLRKRNDEMARQREALLSSEEQKKLKETFKEMWGRDKGEHTGVLGKQDETSRSIDARTEKLLALYFRRIESFYEKGKFNEAKNELSKIYMIDPTNARAKEYESRIAEGQGQELVEKEEDLVKREALLGAEKVLQERQEIKQAFKNILQKRQEDRDGIIASYFGNTGEDQVEFDRLQKLGLEKYKEEVMKEAKQAEKENRYKLAVVKYRDILAIDPNDYQARSKMQQAEIRVEDQMDEFMLNVEQIDDEKLLREVSKSAMGAEDYRSAMEGGGFAASRRKPKDDFELPLKDKLGIPVTADFRDVNLISVLNFLADYTGINIMPSQLVISEERKVSVRFKNLPLENALRYILKGQGLSYRIEEDVIWVATLDEMENEELETKVFYLEKGSGVFTMFSNTTGGTLGGSASSGSSSISAVKNIKDIIEESVSFPPGAKVIFDERLGVLIVTNTPSNLQKIKQILYVLDEPPQQILIESRFIEIQVEDQEAFGIDMNLDETLPLTDKLPGVSSNKYGFLEASGWDFTGVAPAVSSDTGGSTLAFAGLLTKPQYQIFLNAVERSDKTKTLSAPKITTVNNQTAMIKVVTEEVYPTRFEVSLIQQDLNGDGDLDDAGETQFANVPQEFVSRDIGIILEVTPSVGMDHNTITLSIIPEVSSVAATPAQFLQTGIDAEGNAVQSGTGTPNLPRFTTSTLSTTVVLASGETAVLGGLITESRGTTDEKVPVLGDLPLIGKLFRSNQDNVTRRNLVIFITASVLN